MQQIEEKFRNLILGKTLKDIRFYNINERYMVFDPDHKWVIEAGIEFIFEEYIISFAWNSSMLLYDIAQGEIEGLTGELDIYELDFSEHANISKIPGKKIEEINFKWSWYQEMDEEMELIEDKIYIPQEIRIKFEDDILLQVATIVFQFRDKEIQRPTFDSQSMMLVTVNQPVEILEAEV